MKININYFLNYVLAKIDFLPKSFVEEIEKKQLTNHLNKIKTEIKNLNGKYNFKNVFFLKDLDDNFKIKPNQEFFIKKYLDDNQNFIHQKVIKNYDYKLSDFISEAVYFLDNVFMAALLNYEKNLNDVKKFLNHFLHDSELKNDFIFYKNCFNDYKNYNYFLNVENFEHLYVSFEIEKF
jgi:hypothetical protein